MKVTPLASESFGARSMCTLVETPDVTLLLDAGVSLSPYRFSLLPHPVEFQTIMQLRKEIAQAAEKAQIVTVSHYHFDHHTPSYEDWLVNWTDGGETARQIYQGKQVLMKNPREQINASQRQRAWMFQKTGGKHAVSMQPADGKSFSYGDTTVRFSQAVPHGVEESGLGYVVMTVIEHQGERFMFAPDVQGPMDTQTAELILAETPQVLMVGGPPFYLGGFRVEEKNLQRGVENLRRIVGVVPVTVMEHHALRDEQWRMKAQQVYDCAEQAGHRLVTAAEFAGKQNRFLESNRKQLYTDMPPPKEFTKWTRQSEKTISHSKPPIAAAN
ncbi:MAG: hypothetical protein NWF04_04005 [Candidatus Bathyarchaeota archaeon]|nr:hypothetical protein [Candidatus Bathyarchaeota archaeon]